MQLMFILRSPHRSPHFGLHNIKYSRVLECPQRLARRSTGRLCKQSFIAWLHTFCGLRGDGYRRENARTRTNPRHPHGYAYSLQGVRILTAYSQISAKPSQEAADVLRHTHSLQSEKIDFLGLVHALELCLVCRHFKDILRT